MAIEQFLEFEPYRRSNSASFDSKSLNKLHIEVRGPFSVEQDGVCELSSVTDLS